MNKAMMTMPQLLAKLGATMSMAEGRRGISSNKVKLNGDLVKTHDMIEFCVGDIIEIGKRKHKIEKRHLSESV